MHQNCVICEAWNQSKYLIWATFVKQLSSSRGLSRLLRTLVCKNCSNEPRLTQYFYPLGNFGASSPHFTFRITRPNPAFACSSIREESGIAFWWRFCQTWTSLLFAISGSFWLSKLDHKQHFWAGLSGEIFPIISCNRIALAELQSVWVRQKFFKLIPIFIFIQGKSQTSDPTPDICNSLSTLRVWDWGIRKLGWVDFEMSPVGIL